MNFQKILELVCRWYVFIFLNVYATGKLSGGQFYRKGKLPEEVAEMTLGNVDSFELAWTFMGHSYYYILFIGISQLIGAWFLLWERTKLLGVAILIPIMVNIIVFDIIFLDAYGALASAVIYFSMLLAILYFNKEKIIQAIMVLTTTKPSEKTKWSQKVKTTLLILGIMLVIFGLDQLVVNFLGHGKG